MGERKARVDYKAFLEGKGLLPQKENEEAEKLKKDRAEGGVPVVRDKNRSKTLEEEQTGLFSPLHSEEEGVGAVGDEETYALQEELAALEEEEKELREQRKRDLREKIKRKRDTINSLKGKDVSSLKRDSAKVIDINTLRKDKHLVKKVHRKLKSLGLTESDSDSIVSDSSDSDDTSYVVKNKRKKSGNKSKFSSSSISSDFESSSANRTDKQFKSKHRKSKNRVLRRNLRIK